MEKFIMFILLINISVKMVTGKELDDTHNAEIDKLLMKLNKPAIKSIQSPDGDIIDCVHMKNHPIYDHPLFKNHTIQMSPSSYPDEWDDDLSESEKHSVVTQLWTINGKCPENSIPIRRTKREDVLRAESVERFGKKYPNSIRHRKPSNERNRNPAHEYATIRTKVNTPRAKFHGASAIINVWKPYVQTPREFSLAQIWVATGAYHTQLNTIEFGWQVYPDMYGDDNPRYFVYWTADAYRTTGCYNLNCEGFVPTSNEFALGSVVDKISTLDGEQGVIYTTIWKDHHSGHWWLKLGNQVVGYWPSSLFNLLQNGATKIQWGGEIVNYKDGSHHTSTKMGSGRFPQERWKKASFFSNLKIIDQDDVIKHPERISHIVSNPNCYNLQTDYSPRRGHFFFFGGPGRSHSCD